MNEEIYSRVRRAELRSQRALVLAVILSCGPILLLGAASKRNAVDEGLVMKVNRGVVQVGMMIPYFGKELPAGYVWADGKTEWPKEPWVPEHLMNGQLVPNMDNQLLGGTMDITQVASVWNQGKLTATVKGENFTIPAGDAKGGDITRQNSAVHNKASDQVVFWVKGPMSIGGVQGSGGFEDALVFPSTISDTWLDFSAKAIVGTQNITHQLENSDSNPRHLRARWIIRVN